MRLLLHVLCALVSGLCVLSLVGGCDGPSTPSHPTTDETDTTSVSNALGIKFVRIPAGTFQMGSTDGQGDEQPVHEVTISEDFYLSVYEVTQAQWQAIMDDNPSRFQDPWHPVEQVSWRDVQQFVEKLNERGENRYRLPTEAEWEYAVRADRHAAYHFGDDREQLPNYAWYSANAAEGTMPVGRKRSNPHGLHDMYGNVWEWVFDAYDPDYYANSPSVDPRASEVFAPGRVIRGGGWGSVATDMRSANRGWARPDTRRDNIGFRLVREVADP